LNADSVSQGGVGNQAVLTFNPFTTDATGTYNRYTFPQPNFNDYPKLGVWPDAYYMSFNMFSGNSFVGNMTPLFLVGRRTDTVFEGNYWSDNDEPDLDGVKRLRTMPDDTVTELKPDGHMAIVALTHDPKLDDLAPM